MRKRVLKPGDTHLMSPDEEYCRLIYEQQANETFDLSIEVYDVGGVTHKSNDRRLSAEAVIDRSEAVLGKGWETIFAQEYNDWAVYCKKRRRDNLGQRAVTPAKSPISRTSVLGGLAVCTALLAFGWIAGQLTTTRNQSASVADEGTSAVELDEGIDDVADAVAETEEEALPEPGLDEAESISGSDRPVEGGETDGAAALDTESTGSPETVPAIALQADSDPFERAVRVAQETVLDGRVANTREEWEAIAEQWQQAAGLMEDVPSGSDRYDVAQDRIERYENNREEALSEAEKF